jgi:hypothetical protein
VAPGKGLEPQLTSKNTFVNLVSQTASSVVSAPQKGSEP